MRLTLAFLVTAFAGSAAADAPNVSADILPVHSLVARVMDGVGTPDLILPPGADPHGYSMRPSEAAALERADVVFWIGDSLTPWLEKPLNVLAADATRVALLDAPGTRLREVVAVDDDHDEHGHDEHGHDEEGHDEHGHDEKDDHGHDDAHAHGPTDPHAWLDPANGDAWLGIIADVLSATDPANAALYQGNAEAARAEIATLTSGIEQSLAPVRDLPFAVYHDAYGYFQDRFGLLPPVALLSHEAERPSPSRIGELREIVNNRGIERIFVEPQSSTGLVAAVFEGTPATACEIDPVGAGIAPGPKHYWQMLEQIGTVIADCGMR